MKTLLRVLVVSVFLTALGVIAGNAQDEKPCPDLEQCVAKFKAVRTKPCGERSEAIKLGKFIGEEYKGDEENAQLVTTVKNLAIKFEQEDKICIRQKTYNDSFKAKNWDLFFNVSREFINDPTTEKPLVNDVILSMVGVGFDRTIDDKTDKYNNDTVMYAKTAIQNLKSGVGSQTGKFGIFDPFETKDEALGWMNYIIGYIMYERQGETMADKKKEALPYFYEAAQFGKKKSDINVYIPIGEWYANEATTIFNEYTKIRDANNKTDNDESKAKLALSRGYAERAMDAFARAHKIAAANPKIKPETVTALKDQVTKYYKFRFNGKTEGQDMFVSGLIAKPMPDPSSTVTPVILEEPATTTTTTTTTLTAPTTVKSTTTNTRTTDSTTKSTTKPTTKSTTKSTTVKKPVTKKKGTR